MMVCATVASARRSAAEQLAQWRERVSFELGLTVSADNVAVTSDGAVLQGVVIAHPETGKTLLKIRRLVVTQIGRRGWMVECYYPEVSAPQFDVVWQLLHDRLANRRGTRKWTGTLIASHLLWRQGDEISTVPHLECELQHAGEQSRCTLEYWLEDQSAEQPSRLSIVRHRETPAISTTYRWETASGPFPLRLLSASHPSLARLGPRAQFDGVLEFSHSAADALAPADGKIEGRLLQVDLAELVTRNFPHHIARGEATIDFAEVRWRDGRLQHYEGVITSDSGSVSRSLLDAAHHVGMKVPVRLANFPVYGYRDLRLQFVGQADQLTLSSPLADDVVLTGADPARTQLLVAISEPADTASLARWLVPDSQHLLPATPAVGQLSNLFHLPALEPNTGPLRTPSLSLDDDKP